MIKAAVDATNGFFQRFISNPSVVVSILIAIFGQVSASIYFQITNNERQEHMIAINAKAIVDLHDSITSMQTPLGSRVIKIEDRIEEGTRNVIAAQEQNKRDFARLEEQQQRIIGAIDNLYSFVTKGPTMLRTKPIPRQE